MDVCLSFRILGIFLFWYSGLADNSECVKPCVLGLRIYSFIFSVLLDFFI